MSTKRKIHDLSDSDPVTVRKSQEFWAKVQSSRECEVSSFLADEKFSDVKFFIGESKSLVHGNRFALASISPVFCAMFYGQMKEADGDTVITLHDIDHEAMRCIIRFSNGVNPGISEKNCVEAKIIAEKYQITSLGRELDNFIIDCLNGENFCSIFNEVCETQFSCLISKCLGKLKDFNEYECKLSLSSKSFLRLGANPGMKLFIESEYVRVPEEILWESCVKWAKFQEDSSGYSSSETFNDIAPISKNLYFDQIKSGIRFPLMSSDFILKKVCPSKILTDADIIAVLSDINCPLPLVRSNFSFRPRLSMQPSSYFVYGAGAEVVNGRYIYQGDENNTAVYKKEHINDVQLTLYCFEENWFITDGFDDDHQGSTTMDDYYVGTSENQDLSCLDWEVVEKGLYPPPSLRALGSCFSL